VVIALQSFEDCQQTTINQADTTTAVGFANAFPLGSVVASIRVAFFNMWPCLTQTPFPLETF